LAWLFRRFTSSTGSNTPNTGDSAQQPSAAGSSQPAPSAAGSSQPAPSAAGSSQQQQAPSKIYWIAFIIIISSFVFIAVMLYIHYVTLQNVLNSTFNSKNIASNNATVVKDLIDHVNTSNQTVFNMLLPVFGAWVGVVVAFYFGNEQAKRTEEAFTKQAESQHDLIKSLSSDEEKLSTVKVQTLLDKFPDTKNIRKVMLKDTIADVIKTFGSFSDVLVVKNDDKPLGVLYKQDLYSLLPPKEDIDKEIENKKTGQGSHQNVDKTLEIIGNIKQEAITNGNWDTINGVKNFVRVTADESLLSARAKMYAISNKVNDVRCVVVNDLTSDLPIGIFSYDSILYFTK
jgi:CBS domain